MKSSIIKEVLNAVVNGPFIDDNEFFTLFGLSKDAVNEVLVLWPNVDLHDEAAQLAINNSFTNLIGYPIDHAEKWSEYLSLDKKQLAKIFNKWKGEVYGAA